MKKVTIVLGLGLSGVSAAEFLLKQNLLVLGIDSNRSLLQGSGEIRRLQKLGLFVQHDSEPIDWHCVERLIVSPGISPKHPLYAGALAAHTPIQGEAELALPHFQKPLVAVTGTNGKTTVTLLVEHVLNSVGIKTKALGNVGCPLCSYLLKPSDEKVCVVELSSYQLETLVTPVFDAAVLLNISPDHLERYEDMDEYAKVKCHLQHLVKENSPFYVQERTLLAFSTFLSAKNVQGFPVFENLESLYTDTGKHDIENATAAWALCRHFSVTQEQFCCALQTFKKPPHRIEFVGKIKGICFYDDSKGTNVDAVVKAVESMKGPVILIAGGVDKGASYLSWKEDFLGKVKQIIAIGQAAEKIYSELHPYFNIKLAESLDLAVHAAIADAQPGDVVLLSPGGSSFDMFRDYAHRGEKFKHCVHTFRERSRL